MGAVDRGGELNPLVPRPRARVPGSLYRQISPILNQAQTYSLRLLSVCVWRWAAFACSLTDRTETGLACVKRQANRRQTLIEGLTEAGHCKTGRELRHDAVC